MKKKTKQTSSKRKNLTKQQEQHVVSNKLNQNDLDVNDGELLKNDEVVVSTVNVTPDITTPKRRRKNWKECFSERRQSRRLSKLPPLDIIIKTEDGEVSTHYDDKSFDILKFTKKIKKENKIKCEVFDDIDSNNQDDLTKTFEIIDKIVMDESENHNLSFDQSSSIDEINLKTEPIDGPLLLDEGHDEKIKSLDMEELQNETVKSINDEFFDEDQNESDMSFDQNKSLSRAHLKITAGVGELLDKTSLEIDQYANTSSTKIGVSESQGKSSIDTSLGVLLDKNSLKVENEDGNYSSVDIVVNESLDKTSLKIGNQEASSSSTDISISDSQSELLDKTNFKFGIQDPNNSSIDIDVSDSLDKTHFKVDYIDLTTDEDDQIHQKPVPKLRVISPKKLFKSPPPLSKTLENNLTPTYDNCLTESSVLSDCISNPTLTNSEHVNISNYNGLSYTSDNSNVNNDKNYNLPSFSPKILECWSYATSDRQVYSEETYNNKFTHEVHSKITEKAETPSHCKTYFEVTENESPQSKDVLSIKNVKKINLDFEMTKLNNQETNSNITENAETPLILEKNLNVTDMEATFCHENTRPKIIMETKKTLLPQKTIYSKIKSVIKTTNLPKKYSEMTITEKRLFREKLNYMSTLGLVPIDQIKNIRKDEKTDPKFLSKSKLHEVYTERAYYRTSSEKLRRSYLLEYSNDANEIQKHKAIPVLVPEKTSGLSFHEGRTCRDKCSSCHGKFGLLDTPCHIAQIKNPNKQKACLENSTHLIGPESCLCTACFRAIEKRSCSNYLQKDACIVMPCKRSANRTYKSPLIHQVKILLAKKGVILKTWASSIESMPICHIHYNQIENITQCQLCGCRTMPKYKVTHKESLSYQMILHNDKIPLTIDSDLFICKPCWTYFLWQTKEKINLFKHSADFEKHRLTVLQSICTHRKVDLPPCLKMKTVIQPSIKAPSSQLIQTQINKQVKSPLVLVPTVNNVQPLKPNNHSNQLSTTFAIKKPIMPIYKEPTFVPVLKPVDNVEFLSSFETSTKCSLPIRKPIQLEPNKISTPLFAKPALTAKQRRQQDGLKIASQILKEPMELFNELLRPYSSPRELINHLLVLEKLRRLSELVLMNNPYEKTKVNKINLQSKVNNYYVHNNGTSITALRPICMKRQVNFSSSNNQIVKKLRVGNNSMADVRPNFIQQNTLTPFVPFIAGTNCIKILQTVQAKSVYNPAQTYSKNICGNYKGKKVVITKAPTTLKNTNYATNKTAKSNTILYPSAIISNIGVSSQNSATSQIIPLNTNSFIPPAKVITPTYIKLLPQNSIIMTNVSPVNRTLMNLSSANKEIGEMGNTLKFVNTKQLTVTRGTPLWQVVSKK